MSLSHRSFANKRPQQACDLSIAIEGQPGLPKVKGERPLQNGVEAGGEKSSHLSVRIDIEDELKRVGPLGAGGADKRCGEQCTYVVGAAPGQRATRIMNGLEVEPVRDAGVEVDHDVLGHGVAVC